MQNDPGNLAPISAFGVGIEDRAVQRSLTGCGESKMQHVLDELVCDADRGFA
jgi:hypothetical protein